MVGMIRSIQPWSPPAKILLIGYFLSHLETCNHVALSLHGFWHAIFLDEDYGLEKDNDFPRVTLQLRVKPRANTQAFRFVNLLFTQHPATSSSVEGGKMEALVRDNLQLRPLPSDPHRICGHWASVTVLIPRILSYAEEEEGVWWAAGNMRRSEGFRLLTLSSWELAMRDGF